MLVAEPKQREIPVAVASRHIRIALAGNPNTGKSTLFNLLTGLNQHTGNFPGATVDRRSGITKLGGGRTASITDLPGTYSLHPKSLDEEITCRVLSDQSDPDHPDLVLVVADATNIKRHLFLCTQLIDLGLPCVLALNMADQLEKAAYYLDVPALAEGLGIPVIPVSARKNIGIGALREAIEAPAIPSTKKFVDPASLIPDAADSLASRTGLTSYQAYFFLHQPTHMSSRIPGEPGLILPEYHHLPASTTLQARESVARYKAVTALLSSCLVPKPEGGGLRYTSTIDRIVTHRVFGLLIFLSILFLLFQAIFTFSQPPMDFIEGTFASLANLITTAFPGSMIGELFAYGLVQGLGGVLMFVPQIAFLFGFLALLEDSGYMARACYMMDRVMKKFGLNGRSVIPLLSGIACAVPAIMGTRTIGNWKERLSTILVIPLMSCSARLPVFVLLISLVIPEKTIGGIFTMQGLVLFLLYLGGILAVVGTALMLKVMLKTRDRSLFIMEMPPYRLPRMRSVTITIWQKIKVFVLDVGRIIVPLSVILWVLATFGPPAGMRAMEEEFAGRLGTPEYHSAKLEQSYIGHLGRQIEPLIRPLGMDWKMGISIITSFAAREVFVSTMATIYSVGDGGENTLRERMKQQKTPNGQPVYNLASGLSLLVFYLFALQCMSTLAVVRRETGSWKWPVFQFVYMGSLAWLGSFVVFRIFA